MSRRVQDAEKLFGYDYRLNGSGTQLMFWCKWCQTMGEGEPKLYVGIDSGGYYCQRCEATGYVQVDRRLVEHAKASQRPPMELDEALPTKIPRSHAAYDYLRTRGLSDADIEYYNFYIGQDSSFDGGVICPTRYTGSKSFLVRIYDRSASWRWTNLHKDVRWWNAPGFKKRDLLWNHAYVQSFPTVVLAEGIFSATSCGKNALCTFGKDLAGNQIELLVRLPAKKFVLCFDGDPDAYIKAWTLARKLNSFGKQTSVVELPVKTDPNDYSRKEMIDYIRSAIPYDDITYFQRKLLYGKAKSKSKVSRVR